MTRPPRTLRRTPRRVVVVLLGAAAAGLGGGLAACGGPRDDARLRVVATVAPVDEAVRRVGGERVRSINLTPVGGGPHDLAVGPEGRAALGRAQLVFVVGQAFQPEVARAVAGLPPGVTRVDVLGGLPPVQAPPAIGRARSVATEGDGADPHLWVSPRGMASIVERVRGTLVRIDPEGRAAYDRRAGDLAGRLAAIDRGYRSALETCRGSVIVSTHAAYGALARDYGLQARVVPGIAASTAPAPATLAALRRFAKAHRVRTLFLPGPVPARLRAAVDRATGLGVASLSPVEGFTQTELDGGRDVLTALGDNLRALVEGLGCGTAPTDPNAEGDLAPSAATPRAPDAGAPRPAT